MSPLISFSLKLANILGRYFEATQILLLLTLLLPDFDIRPCDESTAITSGEFA